MLVPSCFKCFSDDDSQLETSIYELLCINRLVISIAILNFTACKKPNYFFFFTIFMYTMTQ